MPQCLQEGKQNLQNTLAFETEIGQEEFSSLCLFPLFSREPKSQEASLTCLAVSHCKPQVLRILFFLWYFLKGIVLKKGMQHRFFAFGCTAVDKSYWIQHSVYSCAVMVESRCQPCQQDRIMFRWSWDKDTIRHCSDWIEEVVKSLGSKN